MPRLDDCLGYSQQKNLHMPSKLILRKKTGLFLLSTEKMGQRRLFF